MQERAAAAEAEWHRLATEGTTLLQQAQSLRQAAAATADAEAALAACPDDCTEYANTGALPQPLPAVPDDLFPAHLVSAPVAATHAPASPSLSPPPAMTCQPTASGHQVATAAMASSAEGGGAEGPETRFLDAAAQSARSASARENEPDNAAPATSGAGEGSERRKPCTSGLEPKASHVDCRKESASGCIGQLQHLDTSLGKLEKLLRLNRQVQRLKTAQSDVVVAELAADDADTSGSGSTSVAGAYAGSTTWDARALAERIAQRFGASPDLQQLAQESVGMDPMALQACLAQAMQDANSADPEVSRGVFGPEGPVRHGAGCQGAELHAGDLSPALQQQLAGLTATIRTKLPVLNAQLANLHRCAIGPMHCAAVLSLQTACHHVSL
jgi:hypothetical protein